MRHNDYANDIQVCLSIQVQLLQIWQLLQIPYGPKNLKYIPSGPL